MLAAGALALLLSGVFALLPPGEPETIVLDNGSLSIHVVDPDSGYYRGSRFESAGFILKLICSGHNWFGRNYEKKRNPEWHDHVCGNAEDFKFPVMDPETAQFLKLGNGIYQGFKGEKYFMFKKYACLKRFEWTLQREPLALTFRQNIPEWNGYAYDVPILYVTACIPSSRISFFVRLVLTFPITLSRISGIFVGFCLIFCTIRLITIR